MLDQDHLVSATALEGNVRAFALDATRLVGEMATRHGTFPAVTAALGRTAMGALLLGAASLKEADQLLTLEINGRGPVGRIICTANGQGQVRGFVSHPQVHAESDRPGKLNVAGVVGTNGFLAVTKDLGMREPYRGTVELQSGEIGEDLAFYLARSEQIPSAVGVGVFVVPDGSVDAAGGFLVQLLPGLKSHEVSEIEKLISALPHPTHLIHEGHSPRSVLEMIFPAGFDELHSYPVGFHCPCSRERIEAVILSLGNEEVQRIIEEEDDATEVVCHFCNEVYSFSPDELREISSE